MQRIKLILILILIHGICSAQENRSICIPFSVAKQIKHDLILKDSAESVLVFSDNEISILNKTIEYKDSVIDAMTLNHIKTMDMVENEMDMNAKYKKMVDDCKNQFTILNKSYASYKRFMKFVGFIGVSVITGLTSIVIFTK